MKKAFMTRIFALLALAMSLPLWAAGPVNINTADSEALAAALKGIGPSKAEAIIAYREAYGAFKDADELVNVKGIGLATVNNNRDLIVTEDEQGN